MQREPDRWRIFAGPFHPVPAMGRNPEVIARCQGARRVLSSEAQASLALQQDHPFVPVLVVPLTGQSGVADGNDGSVAVWVTSDLMKSAAGKLTWRVTDAAGTELQRGSADLTIPPRESHEVRKLALKELLEKHGTGNVLVWLGLEAKGAAASQNLCLFAKPKDLKLSPPEIRTTIEGKDSRWTVTLDSNRPALWT